MALATARILLQICPQKQALAVKAIGRTQIAQLRIMTGEAALLEP